MPKFYEMKLLAIAGYISLFLIIIIFHISCYENIITVEMFDQNKKLIIKLDYEITTTQGNINLNKQKKQYIQLNGEILKAGISSVEYYPLGQYDQFGNTMFFNEINKKIIIYNYLYKYGIIEISSLDTIFEVEPFNNFSGIYTEQFIFNKNLYQVISLSSKIELSKFVEEFDYDDLFESGLSQYKIVKEYTEEDEMHEQLNKNNRTFSYHTNYIFLEEMNKDYIKY